MTDEYPRTEEFRDLGRTVRAAVARVDPLAWSADGVEFEFEVPVVHPLDVGAHVLITTDDDRRYLGYVVHKEIVRRDSTRVSVDLPAGAAVNGGVRAEVPMKSVTVQGLGKLLVRLDDDQAAPVTAATGADDRFVHAHIDAPPPELVAAVLGRDLEHGYLDVGQMSGVPSRVLVKAAGFNRHSFLCGQSGSGKTFAFGVLLERLLTDTDLRLVVLDPNGDYTRLGVARDESAVVGPPVLPGRPPVADLLARYQERCGDVVVLRPRLTDDPAARPLVLALGDLDVQAIGQVLSLDPVADADAYAQLVRVHAEGMEDGEFTMDEAKVIVGVDPRTRELAQRAVNLGIGNWGVWARDGEQSVIDVLRGDARVVVIDLSGFEQRREASTVALAVLDHLWASRNDRRATLIAIDEAHNVCPAHAEDPMQQAAADQVDRIAAEGRKFGLHLLIATQLPTKIPQNALSQCENLVLMRMNSASDIAAIAETFSFVPSSLLEQSRRFGQGQTLLAGGIVGEPVLARFDRRLSEEPGGDVPTTWAVAADRRTQ